MNQFRTLTFPHTFVQDALEEAHAAGRGAEVAAWRRRLHRYLDALFRKDPDVAADYHHLQVRPSHPC